MPGEKGTFPQWIVGSPLFFLTFSSVFLASEGLAVANHRKKLNIFAGEGLFGGVNVVHPTPLQEGRLGMGI